MKLLKSLRSLLIVWYIGSLFALSVFFYLIVHILQLPYGTEYFIFLFISLALIGLLIIFRITKSLNYLNRTIKSISSENLHERVIGINSENEIGELAKSFNNLLDRLDKAFKRERQFIADVAHELKTPTATLQSGIEITLTKERTKEVYKEALEEALIDARRQSSTLNKILELARSEASSLDEGVKSVNLKDLFDELHEIISKLAMKKNISIEESLDENIIVAGIKGKDKLAQAFLNILENAVKYTPENGKIIISLKKDGESAKIQVTDTGIGIAEKDLPHIFERFYRGSATKKTQGSGLGMAITQSIIQAHQGKIKVKSTPGRGTTIIITLPVMKVPS